MTRYVALLRGINVGGRNMIRMADLRTCFEGHGLRDVATYIQSGNVLFTAAGSNRGTLTRQLEDLIATTFDCPASVVLRTLEQMQDVVRRAPDGFGAEPAAYRYDVIFLKDPLRAATAMKSVSTKEGVDEAHAGTGVLYYSRLISRASSSHLSRLVSQPVYQQMTIRNWNTTTRLVRLMEGREA